MMRILLLATVSLVHAWFSSVHAWEWPVETPRIIEGFMSVDRGMHQRGIVVKDINDNRIYPLRDGRVLISISPITYPTEIHRPHALGGFMIIEHEQGIRTLYAGVNPQPAHGIHARQGTPIATTLHTESAARENRGEFMVTIFDPIATAYLNPLFILPRLRDVAPPRLLDYTISTYTYGGEQRYFIATIHIRDRRFYVEGLASTLPPHIYARYGDQERYIVLDSIVERNGMLFVGSHNRALSDTITPAGHYIAGPFRRGDASSITVTMADYRSNRRSERLLLEQNDE